MLYFTPFPSFFCSLSMYVRVEWVCVAWPEVIHQWRWLSEFDLFSALVKIWNICFYLLQAFIVLHTHNHVYNSLNSNEVSNYNPSAPNWQLCQFVHPFYCTTRDATFKFSQYRSYIKWVFGVLLCYSISRNILLLEAFK